MIAERAFEGIWIPAELWLDRTLSITEKVMLVEIKSLSKTERGCWASNAHFADMFDLSKSRVSEIISALVIKGYLDTTVKREGSQIVSRSLFLKPPSEKADNPIRKTEDPYSEKAEGKVTKSSNTKSKGTGALESVKKARASGVKVTLRAYLEANPNPEWVPVDGKVHKHMKGSGIPMEWLVLAIHAFSDKFIDDPEPRYVNWAASFANYVVEGWLDLWYHDAKSNGWALTRTKGMAYQIKVNGGTGNV